MVGIVTSEGDRAMRTDIARQLFNLDGTGIKIGVIANSFDALKAAVNDVSSGDLPGEGNPNGYTQSIQVLKDNLDIANEPFADEGRAMLQGIHDVAPGAKLLFHSFPFPGSDEDYITAAKALADAGADIIVDDVGFTTSIFQDGAAAQAINDLTQQGIVVVQAAGNGGTTSYESDFRSGGTFTYQGTTYEAHDFDPGTGADLYQNIQIPGDRSFSLLLGWDEPIGNVNSEYKLFLVDRPQLPESGGQVVSESVASSGDIIKIPSETLDYATAQEQIGYLVVARQQSDTPSNNRIKWINSRPTDLGTIYQYVNDRPGATGSSTIFGDQNAQSAIAVGAADFNKTPEFGVNPTQIEFFSPTGAASILFDSQGNRLLTPEIRQKPDILGPDRYATTVGGLPLNLDPSIEGFERFIGTSASAPQVAAAIALMIQRAGGPGKLTTDQIRAVLQQTATPAVDPQNNLTQAGFIQASDATLQSFATQQIGTEGDDSLQGTDDADNLWGLSGNDALSGASGFDALFGGDGQDTLNGDGDNDYLLGMQGDDVLLGGDGQDVLVGGAGSNQLIGGNEKDTFMLDLNGLAVIQDFQVGQDVLALPEQLRFPALDIVQQGMNTLIQFSGNDLAELNGVSADLLGPANFITVSWPDSSTASLLL